jgi:hypothetical protein
LINKEREFKKFYEVPNNRRKNKKMDKQWQAS